MAKLKGARKFIAAMAPVASIAAATGMTPQLADVPTKAIQQYRTYQQPVVFDHTTKSVILHWSRQIGKSHTLAGWSVHRLLKQLQTHDSWLVTVLSNSRKNGAELLLKVHDVCRKLDQAFTETGNREQLDQLTGIPEDVKLSMMHYEVRLEVGGRVGRILVLAANPDTARGFSGDLILDEFAFHKDSAAIWDAAEPIISANPEFLLRISSTGNGRRNMFYRLIASGDLPYYRVRRSEAHALGEVKIYSLKNNKELTPAQARAEAKDKRSYDQNYECEFNDEATALLTAELIQAASREGIPVDEQSWSSASIARMAACKGLLFAGQDVGRNRDLSVQTVLEKIGQSLRVVGMLRMENKRLPAQQAELNRVLELPQFRRIEIDMTGLGTGLVEYAQDHRLGGFSRVAGVNFASTEPLTKRIMAEGRKAETARVTEIMATEMLGVFEDKRIEIPNDNDLFDDLRKPEKLTSPGGRVSIAAVRDDSGHADHFWSIALAIRASTRRGAPPPPPRRNLREGAGARAGRAYRSRSNRSLPG